MSSSNNPEPPVDTAVGLGTLVGAAGTLIGAGVTELQANVYAGLILVVIGSLMVAYRARLLAGFGVRPRGPIRGQ